MYAQCTKYTHRKGEPPIDLGPRVAERTAVKRRTDVEKGTEGKVFWGDLGPEDPEDAGLWRTSQKLDYPHRPPDTHDTGILKARAAVMRTTSTKLGTDATPMARSQMQLLDRKYYVGGIRHRRGEKHSKTRSELYVCPAEVEEWRRRHLSTMSHRQFTAAAAGVGSSDPNRRKSIQQEMLASHFRVAGGGGGGGTGWTTQTQSDFARIPAEDAANARLAPDILKATTSCIRIGDPNSKQQHATSNSLDYPNRLKLQIEEQRQMAERKQGGSGQGGADTPPSPPAGAAPLDKAARTLRHTRHSWNLGYDKADDHRYLSQQRIAFTPVNYRAVESDLSETFASNSVSRRSSLQRMVHHSSIPL